jgi:hypothetical protein
METKLEMETVETDEYVMTKYSNKQIHCDLSDLTLSSLSPGERLALGLTVLAASARGNDSAVTVLAEPGSIYAYAVPPRGKLVPALIESEDEALRKLGWRKAEADDGWFFDTEGGRRED